MKIYFDENFSCYLVNGLREMQAGRPAERIEVLSTVEEFGRGAKDEVWIPEVGKASGIAITQDLNIHRHRAQWQLCQTSGLGVFFFTPPKKKKFMYWQWVCWTLEYWEFIAQTALKERAPFGYRIKKLRYKQPEKL